MLVTWKELHRVKQFPRLLLASKHNHLFSPNFDYYLTCQYNEQVFQIRRTDGKPEEKTKEDKFFKDGYYEIPESMFSTTL